jgi:PAS domain S-box-containing protein
LDSSSQDSFLSRMQRLVREWRRDAASGGEKRQEISLRDALTFAASIVDTVREPLVVLDARLRVLFANPAFYRTFQVTPEETEDRFIYDLGNRQWDIPQLRELLEKIIPQKKTLEDFEVEHDFPVIGRKVMLLNARLIPARGSQPHLILLAIEDVTARKEAQEALRRANEELEIRVEARTRELAEANRQLCREIEERRRAEEQLAQKAKELARSNADLEQFAYLVSHDLQEPLHVAAGFLQLLARRYQGHLDPKGQEFITCALDSLSRLEQQIKDLLDYSRVTTRGKDFTWVEAGEVVEQVLKDMSLIIQEKKATVTVAPLPRVKADASQLARVFQNLIGNALKFSGDDPPDISLGAERGEGEWRFWVKDRGIGIHPKDQERIFLMFERLHARSRYPGTGIGLTICKKIIERHGGRIWVESEPGAGSTFYFTIPIPPEDQPS